MEDQSEKNEEQCFRRACMAVNVRKVNNAKNIIKRYSALMNWLSEKSMLVYR